MKVHRLFITERVCMPCLACCCSTAFTRWQHRQQLQFLVSVMCYYQWLDRLMLLITG